MSQKKQKGRNVKVPAADQLYGWRVGKRIGGGGNGEVYRVAKGGEFRALKVLHRVSKKDQDRFHDEIEAMRRCADIAGVLPVFESSSGVEQADTQWFMTGLATELTAELGRQPALPDVVIAMHDCAEVLAEIHDLDISHRDIKPENLFFYQKRWTVGDFGLASFAGKKAVTAERGKLGPLFYLAPEMFNDVKKSDGKSADVYSLAKTLWKLATGEHFPLPGSYTPIHQAFRIGTYLPGQTGLASLDKLIAAATAFQPSDRPSMRQFAAELKAWLTPRVEKPMAIKINIGQHLGLLEDLHLNEEAQREYQAAQAEANAEAVARVIETLSPFIVELRSSILEVSKAIRCDLGSNKALPKLTISVPGREKATLELAVEVNTAPNSTVTTNARIALQWHAGAGLKVSLWNSEVSYLNAGSEEATKLQLLCSEIAHGLQESLIQALDLSFNRSHSALKPRKVQFTIERRSGLPAEGASIHLLSSDGVTLVDMKTAADGTAQYELASDGGVVAFISHPECCSATLVGLHSNNKVILNEQLGSYSRVQKSSWVGIQGMVGQLSLGHDGSQRMYMYLEDFSVEGGATGAIFLSLGKAVRIKDKHGVVVSLTVRAVIGDCYILDFQRNP